MDLSRDRLRRLCVLTAALAGMTGLVAVCLGAAPCAAATPASTIPQIAPPMQFVRVVSAEAGCQPSCPEWIAADGQIMVGTAQIFARFVAGLGGRRLPILINSPGGSMPDAMAMGRLIRARRLAVAVARTEILPCPSGAPKCAPARATAKLSGSRCLSACPVVLAGGIERYVSGLSPIGVHQMKMGPKTMTKRMYQVQYRIVDGQKQEISRTLMSEEHSIVAPTSADLSSADASVAKYLAQMGIGDSIFKSMLATPSSGIDLLTNAELVNSRLATLWMEETPFASTIGPQGLAGDPVGSSSVLAATFVASPTGRVLDAVEGRRANLQAALQFRRGAGAIFVTLALVDAQTGSALPWPPASSFFIANGKLGAFEFDQPKAGSAATGTIPLRDFCRLRGARIYVSFAEPRIEADEERARDHLALIEFAKAPGAAALFEEACPPGGFAGR